MREGVKPYREIIFLCFKISLKNMHGKKLAARYIYRIEEMVLLKGSPKHSVSC